MVYTMRKLVIAVFTSAMMVVISNANAKVLQASSDWELALAISNSRDGDTIELVPGNYGQIMIIGGRYNQVVVGNSRISRKTPILTTDVTIQSQNVRNKATIKNIDIRGSNHRSFSDLDIRPGVRGSAFFAVKFNGTSNSIKNSTISYGDSSAWTKSNWNTRAGRGVWLSGADHVVQNNYFESVNFGVTVDHAALNAQVLNNTIDGLSGDGFCALGNYGVYEGNLIKNFKHVNSNHDDCLQSFSKKNGVVGKGVVRGITVRGNVCIGRKTREPIST